MDTITTIGNFSIEGQYMNLSDVNFQQPGHQHVYTYSEVLDQFSDQFLFRTALMTAAFLITMVYLQFYTTSIQKEHKGREREAGYKLKMKNRDVILILISDVFFLASVAYGILFAAYYLGIEI